MLVAGVLVVAVVTVGATRAGRPAPTHDLAATAGAGCSCHQGSVFADHTSRFVELDHAREARAAPERCASCHRDPARECAACHDEQPPPWHDEQITRPDLDADARRAHGRAAREHERGCGGCHAARFATECARCHRASEAWVRGAP